MENPDSRAWPWYRGIVKIAEDALHTLIPLLT